MKGKQVVELVREIIEGKNTLVIKGMLSEEHMSANRKKPAYNKITITIGEVKIEITGCFACEALFLKDLGGEKIKW